MATLEGQAKILARAVYNIAGNNNSTDIFMATVAHYDAPTGNLFVVLDGNDVEVKAIPIGEHYDIGRRVMCSVNNFGNLFAIGQDEKAVQQLMRRAWFDVDEIDAGDSLMCHTDIVQKDAVLAYEWSSSMYPDRKRSGIAYTTTDADVGDVLFCRVYDKSGKYSGFLTTGTCVVVKRYDPLEDYDFGREVRTASLGSATYGSYVQMKDLGGTSAKLDLDIYNALGSSSKSKQPVFLSDFVCISVNAAGNIGIFTHGGASESLMVPFGVHGDDWKYTQFGGWNQSYHIVVEGDKVFVNDEVKVSGLINSGWGTYIPQWGGLNLDNGGFVRTHFISGKLYTDGAPSLDLKPAKKKNEPDYVSGNVGLFDTVENIYYPGTGRLEFVAL